MSNVISLKPSLNIPEALRNIADSIENGKNIVTDCTVIAGFNIYHLGCMDDGEAARDAVFNMTYGLQKIMTPVVDASFDA